MNKGEAITLSLMITVLCASCFLLGYISNEELNNLFNNTDLDTEKTSCGDIRFVSANNTVLPCFRYNDDLDTYWIKTNMSDNSFVFMERNDNER